MLKRVLVLTAILAAVALAPPTAGADGVCPPSPKAVWTTGLEHGMGALGTPNLWISNMGGQLDGTIAKTGKWSLRERRPDYGWVAYTEQHLSSYRNAMTFAIRLDTLPSGDVTKFASVKTTGSHLLLGFRDSDDRLTLRWGAHEAKASSFPVLEKTWYTIDLRWETGANPMTADWSIDLVPQESTSVNELAYNMRFQFGSDLSGDTPFTAHFDDIVHSYTPSDYPIGPTRVVPLRPSSTGAFTGPERFRDDDGSAVDPTSWSRLDDARMDDLRDGHVKQVSVSTASNLEFGFDDTLEPCVDAVQAISTFHKTVSKTNHAKTSVFEGPVESVIYNGDVPNTNVIGAKTRIVPPALGAWTPVAVNALTVRLGYSSDVSPEPMWDGLLFEMAVPG
ncbi:MAG TPA: hypothetical protein VHF89_14300 [Solirubrobacteraceae bacterium]|nr:hypothetical protein [Solirubrobacteraceae bacterium]